MTIAPRPRILAALLLALTACVSGTEPSAASPPPLDAPRPTTPPQYAPPPPDAPPSDPRPDVTPTPMDTAPLSAPLSDALARVPPSVDANYVFSLSPDRAELTIDPRPRPAARARDVRGFEARDSVNGGKIITLAGGPFRAGAWVRASFRQRVAGPAQLDELRRAGYDLDQQRDLLVVDGEADRAPTVFAFSANAAKPGIVGICTTVTILDFAPGQTRPIVAVRKPVIYLYPPTPTELRVQVEIDGDFIATYPDKPADGWRVRAEPSGALVDRATGRRHRYLFWEGTSTTLEIDPAQAHCVARGDTVAFLEGACDRFALTADECGDLVSYWLPALSRRPYNVIQFVDEPTYERYARLRVEPRPDAVIRPFLLFRGSDAPVAVGAPELPQRTRGRFTVVEWGGADLGPRARAPGATPAFLPRPAWRRWAKQEAFSRPERPEAGSRGELKLFAKSLVAAGLPRENGGRSPDRATTCAWSSWSPASRMVRWPET